MRLHPLGLYEKALPDNMSWAERFDAAKACGFDFIEISVDESDSRLARLNMSRQERLELVQLQYEKGMRLKSMCLSGHRKYPFGSHDPQIREKAMEIMEKAIELAVDLGIRTIQLAGYDVYYEKQDESTLANYAEGMLRSAALAAAAQVTIATEIMDTPFMGAISRWKKYDALIKSQWFAVYPDVGNLCGWNNDPELELGVAAEKIAAIHLKETKFVRNGSKGQFRDLLFGEGDMDFVRIFRALKQLNYRGSFVIEMWGSKSADPLGDIVKARTYLEARMKEAGFCP